FGADTRPSNTNHNSSTGAQTTNAVRHLTLPRFEPNMPIAPGRDEFMRTCVSCHSARYVTMQPPFPRRQWEQTVRKMITAYGAPVDEFQVGKITDYLYAIDGDGPGPLTRDSSADDDEIGTTSRVALLEATESAPVFEVSANGHDRNANVLR